MGSLPIDRRKSEFYFTFPDNDYGSIHPVVFFATGLDPHCPVAFAHP